MRRKDDRKPIRPWRVATWTLAVGLALASAASAQTILTLSNGIISNSLCVGFDCATGTSFSDTTILLRENNTRIKFDDTSSLSGFPNNDWELQANSNLSGGPNRFALNDCGVSSAGGCADDAVFAVEAGARQFALYVESDGDIGVGTSNPVADLHIVSGNSPFVRLEQDGSAGFTPHIWDVAGNETNFFVRDVTSGSRLPLRIRPNAPTNSIFIEGTTGEVGIGTSTPDSPLHVVGNMRIEQTAANTTSNFRLAHPDQTWLLQNNGTNDDFELRDVSGGATPFAVENGAPAGFFRITSGGQVQVSGVPVHPDYVFEPGYELESIEEHAESMWAHGYLPAVGAGRYDGAGRAKLDLVGRSQGMLEELEKAHIYIERLNNEVKRRGEEIAELRERVHARDAQLEALQVRLARLEEAPSSR